MNAKKTKTGVVSIGPLTKICRICLQQTKSMFSIFGPSTKSFVEQITYVTSLEFHKDDGLPKQICDNCLKDVHISAGFKKRAVASNTMLNVLLKASDKINDVDKPVQNIGDSAMAQTMIKLVADIGIKVFDQEKDNLRQKVEKTTQMRTNILESMLRDSNTTKNSIPRIMRVDNKLNKDKLSDVRQKPAVLKKVIPVTQKVKETTNAMVKNVDITTYDDNFEILSILEDNPVQKISTLENREPPPLAPLTYSGPNIAIKTEPIKEEYDEEQTKARRYIVEYSGDGKPVLKMLDTDDEELNDEEMNISPTQDEIILNNDIVTDVIDDESMYEEQWVIDETEPDVEGDTEFNESDIDPVVTEVIKPIPDGSVPRSQPKKILQKTAQGRDVYRVMKTKKLYMCDTCPFQTEMRFKLSRHMKHVHLNKLDFACNYPGCNKAFISNGLLTTHKRKHTREKLPKCDICSKTFINKITFLNHRSYVHGGIKRYNCNICEKSFVSGTGLRQHLSIHGGMKPFLCDHCGKSFRMMKSLRSHLETHTEIRKYKCETCGKSFKQSSVLQKHNKVVHEPSTKYICDICDQSFPFPYLKQRHVESVHNLTDKRCPRCNKPFGNDSDLAAHELKHDHPKDLQCDMCLRMYKDDDELKSHICRLAKTSNYYCRECKVIIKGADKFDSHNHVVHNKITTVKQTTINTSEDMQRVPCEHCGKELQKWRMEKHVYNYHNPNRYQCKICDKRLKTLTSYLRHQRMHDGIKPYKCKLCSKEFLQNTSLNYHMMEHTGERPEVCRFCGAAFKRVGDVRVHEKRHISRMSEAQRKEFFAADYLNSKKRTYINEENISKCKTSPKSDSNMEEIEYITEENQEYADEPNMRILTDGIDYSTIIQDISGEQDLKVEMVYEDNQESLEANEEVYVQYTEEYADESAYNL